jgi:hypothetical protein
LFRVKEMILFGLLDPKNEGAIILQNSGRNFADYPTSHPGRLESTFG